MYSKIRYTDQLPKSLYRDKTLWIQVAFSAAFFSTSGIWITAVPRHVKFNLGYTEFIVGISALFFCLAAVLSRPFVNYLGARRNRHELMLVALLIMLLGGLLAMFSDSIAAVLISRMFTGVADGLFYVAISTLVVANATDNKRGRALNLYTISLYIGITLGPIIGEQLFQINQQKVFFLAGLSCVLLSIAQILLLPLIPSRYSEHHNLDKKHAAFCVPAIFPGIIFVFGICAWVGFEQFAPIYGESLGINDVSGIFAIIGVSVIAIRLLASTFIDRMHIHLIIAIALANALIASMVFSFVEDEVAIYIGSMFLAVSLGFFYPGFVLAAMRRGEKYNSGTVLGTMGMFFDMAFGILPPVLGIIAARYSYSYMFTLATGAILIAGVSTFFLKIPPLTPGSNEGDALSDVII